ncbi:SanA/YdcF family protein [Cellulomonas composti]|uniref:Membrane protein n=1 Tax=Cellulomonas composti TaxID=266130 RepID=A0A511J7D6_9CELL|nr:ElyC/SanA/YdcF family protein [Cellulomonas composti]GEL93916.1 membrane protein [Cellulomonas composti]
MTAPTAATPPAPDVPGPTDPTTDPTTDPATDPATVPAADRHAAPRRRRRRRRALFVVLVVVVVLVLPLAWVQGVGQTRVRSLESAGPAPVALVLGAGLRPDGSPSTYLRRRLNAAQSLYEQGRIDVVLVSGDNSTPYHDEPAAMRDYLVERGVPVDHVVLDGAGLDTHDSCVRAHDVFGVDQAVVLTQSYHLRRALFSCQAAGIDVTGVGVSAASVQPKQALMWRLREIPASYKAFWDALTSRRPAVDDEPSPTIDEALATTGS